jgi:serine/tyrosine/threonine adenylyltransferase
MATLEHLTFDNTYARLPETFRHRVDPTPVPDPYLIAFNADAAALIGLDPAEAARPEFTAMFAGNVPIPGSEPVAMKYAGHQFGSYVPQLGDGRAILLGEAVGPQGRWDLHLKGGGQTAFSRFGDGRAVLRSSIREYLCSEAMHALGIPTTRALCVIGTPMPVFRESLESGALVTRMAPSHLRFGSFEVFAYRGQTDEVKTLADYAIAQHFPQFATRDDKYAAFYGDVVRRTARLVAQWQSVGFAHGVLNTDNMSILGLTLDYGPYGFVEDYDPGYICNHSDESGRYAFDQQPRIGYWNCAALAQALLSLIDIETAKGILESYATEFNAAIGERMRQKLGLTTERDGDAQLWQDALDLLEAQKIDYTRFWRKLVDLAEVRTLFPSMPEFDAWAARYRDRLRAEPTDEVTRREMMNRVNPKYILRNYLAQTAIERAATRDFREVNRLFEVLKKPYDEQPEFEAYAAPAPAWGKKLVISCSS